MPKRLSFDASDKEIAAILQIAADPSRPVSIDEIKRALKSNLSRRTLQRRLEWLVHQGKLKPEGKGRGSRYRLVVTNRESESESEKIRQAVRQPIQARRPIGYRRSFLDDYLPNETFYFSPETRRHLREIGRYPEGGLPAGTYARKIFDRLLIDLSWNSSRLEGNTYSLLETQRLLELGESAEGKGARDAQMILNHKSAIELMVEQAPEIGFNRYTILNLHALLSENLLEDPRACGRLRSIPVEITGTVFQPTGIPQLIEECFDKILQTASAIEDVFEQSFFVMVQLPYLQPFEDVNKRVSRLAANIPLIRQNLCPLSFVEVPEKDYVEGILAVYELNRVELLRDVFVWAYERSCARYSVIRQSLGEPDPFRLRYRASIAGVVGEVVRGGMDKAAASSLIRKASLEKVAPEDRTRFLEVIETELMALHEGNIARYRIRPSEYEVWRKTRNGS